MSALTSHAGCCCCDKCSGKTNTIRKQKLWRFIGNWSLPEPELELGQLILCLQGHQFCTRDIGVGKGKWIFRVSRNEFMNCTDYIQKSSDPFMMKCSAHENSGNSHLIPENTSFLTWIKAMLSVSVHATLSCTCKIFVIFLFFKQKASCLKKVFS